jgi:hypothetical protein
MVETGGSIGWSRMSTAALAATVGSQDPGEWICGTNNLQPGSGCSGVGKKFCPQAQAGCAGAICDTLGCFTIPNIWIGGGNAIQNTARKDCNNFTRQQDYVCEWEQQIGVCRCKTNNPIGVPAACPLGAGRYWGSCNGNP